MESDDAFAELLATQKRNRGVVDEVAAFDTDTHHLFIPLDLYASRMALFEKRLAAFRKAGIPSVGINVLCTIGHVEEAWSYNVPLPFPGMVGHDGRVSRSCACPNTAAMREYVRAKYVLAARARPDFIWVDDDIRMHSHGVAWGCFCDTCLGLFRRSAGRAYTREALVKAFNRPGNGRLRALWVEQNRSCLASLMGVIEKAVHGVDPDIATGLMTAGPGWTTYSGQALDRWCTALRAAKVRPGGGFYSDATPGDMLRKTLEIGRQAVAYPPVVTDRQYELENFPYQLLKKSRTALVDECSLALGVGLNGIAFNLLGIGDVDYRAYVPAIAAARPLWEKLVAQAADLPVVGLWPAWSPDLMAKRTVRVGEEWLGGSPAHSITRSDVLADIGLPLAPAPSGMATVLSGRTLEAFSDEQLKRLFRGGVLMDGTALEALEARGLASWTGVRLAKRLDNGVVERFTGDPLNGPYQGRVRDARIEFWGDARGLGDVLEPTSKRVRILARHETYRGADQGPAMTAHTNALGGRVGVMGYAPWIFLHSVAKRAQLHSVADWASGGRLPVLVEETVPLVPVVRLSADRRRGAIVLLNAGLDEIGEATLRLRVATGRARLLTIGRDERRVELRRRGRERVLTLRRLAPWSVHVLLFGE
jgi:hypothetical protein